MQKIILALFATLFIGAVAHAEADADASWTPVASYLATEQSPSYRDVLIHNPGTYSQVRVQMDNAGYIDRFDIISHILWGSQVFGLDGHYDAGQVKTTDMGATQVRFIRMYVRSISSGQPVHVRVWMK